MNRPEMIDFGMPTLIETAELEDCEALCAELGLRFIELNMNLPQYQLDKIDVARFNKIAAKHDIYYTIHLDENLNVSDFNPYVAEVYRRTVRETIELAKRLGAPVLNMHLAEGVYFTLPDRKVYLYEQYRGQYIKTVSEFRDECESSIGQSGIKICVENCNGYKNYQIEALDALLESPAFGLTFDIGHNHGVGGMDEPIIVSRKDRLCHMHLHDADKRTCHLALGTGELDLQKYLLIAEKTRSRVVLETKTVSGLKESVRWLDQQGNVNV